MVVRENQSRETLELKMDYAQVNAPFATFPDFNVKYRSNDSMIYPLSYSNNNEVIDSFKSHWLVVLPLQTFSCSLILSV